MPVGGGISQLDLRVSMLLPEFDSGLYWGKPG
jgi:hypothetical protein